MTETVGGIEVSGHLDEDFWLNLLVYGIPGAGKTRLAGSACKVEEMAPVLFLDTEAGHLTLRKQFPEEAGKGWRRIEIERWSQMEGVYEDLASKELDYKTIVIDTYTELYKLCMLEVMETITSDKQDLEVASQKEWGKTGNRMRKMTRKLRNLPMHFIIVCHLKYEKDDTEGRMYMMPSIPGKLAQEIPGFVDVVLFLYSKIKKGQDDIEIERMALTQPDGKHYAKDRSGDLDVVVKNPTMQVIHNAII